MFKVLIIACTVLPFPRGEVLESKCYFIKDQWQPSVHGYKTEKECKDRLKVISESIMKNFQLLQIKKQDCIKSQESQDRKRV